MNTLSNEHVPEYNQVHGYDEQYYVSCFNEEQNGRSVATLKVINDMLMEDQEDELENTPSMLHDCLALQATERSFYDALNNNNNNYLAENVVDEHDSMMVRPSEANNPTMQKCKHRSKRGGQPKKKAVASTAVQVESVDLRSLLTTCAQAVSSHDTMNATHLLMQIRRHSSPQGDSLERIAHYFANALEARLAGTGTKLCTDNYLDRIPTVQILRSHKKYTSACPFFKMSYCLANKTIQKLANGTTTLHIIDFGILYGFQWPTLIKMLSERQGGPPKLRITGIEFPQKGQRPEERVVETGQRLAKYCERFGVPFEYNPIAQNWDTIRVKDLKIKMYELVVVNCLNRLHNLFDETVTTYNPRDAVLNLIKNSNPSLFIHGVANGQYNAPFFTTRFKEALFTFSNMFDMLEATVPHEDESRLLFEELFGNAVMNVIACEGMERIDRPEMYKHWQIRMQKAGFRQLPLDLKIVKYVRSTVRRKYHKDFYVDEDGKWMLQGWKGRVSEAISCWQPSYCWM